MGKKRNRKRNRKAAVQYDNPPKAQSANAILNVPPELWALVAKLSRRQVLARMCVVSRGFYAVFSPLLYGTGTTNPPLSTKQAALLVDMLRTTRTPTPASFVQTLVFPSWMADIDAQACFTALEHLFDAPGDGQPVRESALRTLEWGCWFQDSSTDGLGTLLCTPGCFPNLKEIVIRYSSSCTRFEFLRIPRLEKIEVVLTVHTYETWRPSWDALSAELATLPSLSPLLNTLKLKLRMYTPPRATAPPPWDAYSDLRAGINRLRLPALAVLELSVVAEYFDPPAPVADFSDLLFQHPGLTDLTLNLAGMHIPTPADVALFLPRLRVFTGSLGHCAAIAARARELDSLFVLFPQDCDADALPTLFPPGVAPTVTRLTMRAVDEDGYFVQFPYQLSPPSLGHLVAAFPNLTYLDVTIGGHMKYYRASFMTLPRLEYLCLMAHTYVSEREWDEPNNLPAAEYAKYISVQLLPTLVQLTDVRLLLRGRLPRGGCSSCDEDRRRTFGTLSAEYRFWVRWRKGKGGLVPLKDKEEY